MKRTSSSRPRPRFRFKPLSEKNSSSNPIDQFQDWYKTAIDADVPHPNAMTLATASVRGAPTARIVLLKAVDERGFSFFTNYLSVKGRQLSRNSRAAVLFFWPTLERQIRIEGKVKKLSRQESEAYFRSRPRNSRVGAWASRQSAMIENRTILEERFRRLQKEFRGSDVPLPDFWGGYILDPNRMEFWQGRANRLHDRIAYIREGGSWKIVRLSP
jgi:pyridoxamine 5'-phosphate oxidase